VTKSGAKSTEWAESVAKSGAVWTESMAKSVTKSGAVRAEQIVAWTGFETKYEGRLTADGVFRWGSRQVEVNFPDYGPWCARAN
jgi:hypothetical protein